MPISGLKDANQIAIVVRDMDAALPSYAEKIGIKPWDIYTYGPDRLHSMTYRGEDRTYVMKLALAFTGDTMWELIESVQGPNVYQDFLDERGEGLHHVGYYVDDIDDEIRAMADLGYDLLQSGRGFGVDGDGAYAYFDTTDELGCIIEAIELPANMPPAEQVFPDPTG